MADRLFCFGLGYVGRRLALKLKSQGWAVAGTTRSPSKAAELRGEGIEAHVFSAAEIDSALADALSLATHLVTTIPGPPARGKDTGNSEDPVLKAAKHTILERGRSLVWLGYLSNASVYGDFGGAWVDETTKPRPKSDVAVQRLKAERDWLDLGRELSCAAHVFRIGSIYGPHRSALTRVKSGDAKNVVKEGQYVSQIHVDDIVGVLTASMARPNPGAVYNVSDDEPSIRGDSLVYAAKLLGVPPPPEIPYTQALDDPVIRRYYAENKRLSNRRLHDELGVTLLYPTFRQGLEAIFEAGEY